MTASDIRFQSISGHPIAVYIKKPEYGPARVNATKLEFVDPAPKPSLSQTGNTLIIDQKPVPTQDLNVKDLYRTGVLGK